MSKVLFHVSFELADHCIVNPHKVSDGAAYSFMIGLPMVYGSSCQFIRVDKLQ